MVGEERATGRRDGFASVYTVEFLFDRQPAVDADRIASAVARRLPRAERYPDRIAGSVGFAHLDHRTTLANAVTPAQFFVTKSERPPDRARLARALRQSWRWDGASGAAERAVASALAADLFAFGVGYRERLRLFQEGLAGVLEALPCEALHWQPSEQIIRPADFLDSLGGAKPIPLHGALNVRMFRVEDDGALVMDTLGLAALGIADVQCHFRGLAPEKVASVLYSVGEYLFERGNIIETGHTVQGIEPSDAWRCRWEQALLPPRRAVIDLDPGPEHRAGSRRD